MTGDLLSVIIFSPGVALGIEPPTSRSAVKQATDWAIILLWFEIYKSCWIHTTIACLSICTSYDISIQYFLKLLRDGWGGGGAGISFSYYKHDSPAQPHVLSGRTKKSTAKSTSLTVWSPPNSYCIYPTNSIGVSPDSNQKGRNLLLDQGSTVVQWTVSCQDDHAFLSA